MANTHLSLREFNTLYPNKTITDYAKYNWLGGGITPPIPSSFYLDFTKQDTFNELVNAPGWVAAEEHPDFTLYRRNNNFTQVLSAEGTTLSTTGTTSQDRYGLTTTGSSTLNDKFFYSVTFELNCMSTYLESTKRTLLSWFIGGNPSSGDHTRITINVVSSDISISLETITSEGSTSRTVVYTAQYVTGSLITMKLTWDRTNHTLELVLENKSVGTSPYVGTFPYYGGPLGYASIAGTNTASYKPETSLLIRDIELGEIK